MDEQIRIAMWSGPRNISTAMMRAWENRADTEVLDEPFYGAYLATTGLEHPMREAVLAHHPTDWETCVELCTRGGSAPIRYQKHMCQHMIDEAPRGWMRGVRHAFLIRSPQAVAASFFKGWPEMTAEDLGFRLEAELFDRVCQSEGKAPPVLEADDVLAAPEAALRALCAALGVPFDPAMLSWPPGRRSSDGVWGAHWYGSVETSTGFSRPRPSPSLPRGLEGVVEACLPHYQRLRAHRVFCAAPR